MSSDEEIRMERWRRILLFLGVYSILWNMAEAGTGLYFGVEHSQLALTAFAVQSFVEVISSFLVLLRLLSGSSAALQAASPSSPLAKKIIARERYGTRLMGTLFILLALAVIAVGVYKLVEGQAPSSALSGFLVASASCFMMCVLWLIKRYGAQVVRSSVLMQDAICSRTCMLLSLIVVVGSSVWMERDSLARLCGSALCRMWYLDSSLAIFYSLFVLRDGVLAVRASFREDFAGGCGCCQSEKTPLLASSKAGRKGTTAVVGENDASGAGCTTGCCGETEDTTTAEEDAQTGTACGSGSSGCGSSTDKAKASSESAQSACRTGCCGDGETSSSNLVLGSSDVKASRGCSGSEGGVPPQLTPGAGCCGSQAPSPSAACASTPSKGIGCSDKKKSACGAPTAATVVTIDICNSDSRSINASTCAGPGCCEKE